MRAGARWRTGCRWRQSCSGSSILLLVNGTRRAHFRPFMMFLDTSEDDGGETQPDVGAGRTWQTTSGAGESSRGEAGVGDCGLRPDTLFNK